MAASKKKSIVRCRYPKCLKLHTSNEMKKEDATKWGKGSSYYHPDCLHTMLTVSQIRDIFIKEINPLMTGKQIGSLVSIVNNLIFEKHVDVDYILFAEKYFIKNKPGALKYPGGISYIIQDKDVVAAWKKEQDRLLKQEFAKQQEEQKELIESDIECLTETKEYKVRNKSKFANVLGV